MAWAPSYCTTGELRSYVRVGDTADDLELSLAIAAASRAIDRACGRQFGQADTPTARYYTARWDTGSAHRGGLGYGMGYGAGYDFGYTPWSYSAGRFWSGWMAEIDDLANFTGLAVAYDSAGDQTYATTITGYQLRPTNAAADGRPYTELWIRPGAPAQPGPLQDGLRITGLWGWTGVPDAIRQACLLQASRLLARRDSPFGVAGSPEVGSELRLLAKLDADVTVTLRPYRRAWGAV